MYRAREQVQAGPYRAGVNLAVLEDVWRHRPWKVLEPTHPLTNFPIVFGCVPAIKDGVDKMIGKLWAELEKWVG